MKKCSGVGFLLEGTYGGHRLVLGVLLLELHAELAPDNNQPTNSKFRTTAARKPRGNRKVVNIRAGETNN